MIRVIRIGHPSYCHCNKCWQPDPLWRVIRKVGPWVALAACLYIAAHVVLMIARIAPWATRIGQ